MIPRLRLIEQTHCTGEGVYTGRIVSLEWLGFRLELSLARFRPYA